MKKGERKPCPSQPPCNMAQPCRECRCRERGRRRAAKSHSLDKGRPMEFLSHRRARLRTQGDCLLRRMDAYWNRVVIPEYHGLHLRQKSSLGWLLP